MTDNTSRKPATVEMRELSLDEIDATAGAGIISWLRRLFGGDNPQPPRGPFQDKKM
jgi:hypothetical protein